MECPSCHARVDGGQTECPSCGIVLSKWRDRSQRPHTLTSIPTPRPARGRRPVEVIAVVAVILVLFGIAGLWIAKRISKPDDAAPEQQNERAAADGVLRTIAPSGPDFDLAFRLPGRPQGGASNGRELIVASGSDPWGALRITGSGESLRSASVPIIEERYRQKMGLNTLTWNGRNYVGYTTASWFQREGDVFTIHDPKTLQVVDTRSAPPLLGGLAWDGAHYWASTRRNTPDAKEEAWLYKLDADFRVVARTKPPAVGCQGLAWDGSHLWYVDVFSDTIDVLDVSGPEPRLLHSKATEVDYLSGIVAFRNAIWVMDYGENRLQRLRYATRAAWLRGTTAVAEASAIPLPSGGEPVLTAQWRDRFAERAQEDAEAIEWSAELRPDGVWLTGSRIWFGPGLFVKREQASSVITLPIFARYTFTVEHPDGTETKKEFEALAGDNVLASAKLAEASGPGEYSVSLFIHVQFVDAAGTARILNNSGGFVELRR